MSADMPPVTFDDDNPEWTEVDFARAKRGDDIPEGIRSAFGKRRGRPPGSGSGPTKVQVTLRLDSDLVDRFRTSGPGWQTRINDALRRAL